MARESGLLAIVRFLDGSSLNLRRRWQIWLSALTTLMSASGVAAGERAVTAQRVLHAVLNRMKCEAEQRAKERAGEAVANARTVHEEINEKRFHSRIGEEEQRRRRAVNEGLADHECRADRSRIEHRGGNADDQSELIRGIHEHRENDAQSWRAGAVQNSIYAIRNQADHKGS